MPRTDAPGRWYFGVFCEGCESFVPVGRDDSGGRPGARLAVSGTIIATCLRCGHRGRYAAARVEQRQADPRGRWPVDDHPPRTR